MSYLTYTDDDDVENVPDRCEIRAAVEPDFHDLFHDVIEDEEAEDELACHDEVVERCHVTQKFYCPEVPRRDDTSGCHELERNPVFPKKVHYPFMNFSWLHFELLDDAEEVDVGVVDSEVDEDSSCSTVDPQILAKVGDDVLCLVFTECHVLDVSTAAVGRQFAPIRES